MTNLDDNFEALANGDSGAPNVTQAGIAASAVGQSEMKTTTASQSELVNNKVTVALTGGDYTLGWYVGADANWTDSHTIIAHSDTYAANVAVVNNSGSSTTFYFYSRYIQASPPWNLGNGDIPLFVMALVEKSTGDIFGTYVAEDPPWYAHGPHDISPRGQLQKELGFWGEDIKSILNGTSANIHKSAFMKKTSRFKKRDEKEKNNVLKRKFTMEEKNIDMNVVPHLFNTSHLNMNDFAVVLIDPVSSLMEDLRELNAAGENISKLIDGKYITIGNELSGVASPKGVICVAGGWK